MNVAEKRIDFAPVHCAVRSLFRSPVRASVSAIEETCADLLPEELAAVCRARSRRKYEFAAGRRIAKRLLRAFGVEHATIPMDADRCPIWPEGVVGSIAHCEDLCVVVAASTEDVAGLGVDVEPNEPIEPDLWPIVCTKRELDWLHRQPMVDRGRWARVIFCAKEAFYKSWFPRHRSVLDFRDVEIDVNAINHRFRVSWNESKTGVLSHQPLGLGRWVMRGGWVFAGAAPWREVGEIAA
jgi:4'-phosphopantetheinyl transferase EntD